MCQVIPPSMVLHWSGQWRRICTRRGRAPGAAKTETGRFLSVMLCHEETERQADQEPF